MKRTIIYQEEITSKKVLRIYNVLENGAVNLYKKILIRENFKRK